MHIQSEAALEEGLIASLQKMNYEYVQINVETNLKENFKKQLEIYNKKALVEIGREHLTDSEFDKVLIYIEGGNP